MNLIRLTLKKERRSGDYENAILWDESDDEEEDSLHFFFYDHSTFNE